MRSRAIETYKRTLELSETHREVLIGLLLGDACLETQNGGRTYRLKVEQSARHEAYVRHIYELFKPWILSPPRPKRTTTRSGVTTSNWAFQTVSHGSLKPFAQMFYANGRKRVPPLINDRLTPRGFAYWFMDDGSVKSRESKGVVFNTQGFGLEDVEKLVRVVQRRFKLHATIRRQSDGFQIYVSGKSYEDFTTLIEPYLIEDMRYKVPQARRTPLPKR